MNFIFLNMVSSNRVIFEQATGAGRLDGQMPVEIIVRGGGSPTEVLQVYEEVMRKMKGGRNGNRRRFKVLLEKGEQVIDQDASEEKDLGFAGISEQPFDLVKFLEQNSISQKDFDELPKGEREAILMMSREYTEDRWLDVHFKKLKENPLGEIVSSAEPLSDGEVNSEYCAFLRELSQKNGPDVKDMLRFHGLFRKIYFDVQSGALNQNQIRRIFASFGSGWSERSMMGRIFWQPRGYAGDFDLIDTLYKKINPNASERTSGWDNFIFSCECNGSIIRRKKMTSDLILDSVKQFEVAGKTCRIADVACGPCTAEHDAFTQLDNLGIKPSRAQFDCFDGDPGAVLYAKNKLAKTPWGKTIRYIEGNVLETFSKNKHPDGYHRIIAAGIFDYFPPEYFSFILAELYKSLTPRGLLVVGNFGDRSPDRYALTVGNWMLHFRSKSEIENLAKNAGLSSGDFTVNPLDSSQFVLTVTKK